MPNCDYYDGQAPIESVIFTNCVTKAPVDVDAVTLTVNPPSGANVVYPAAGAINHPSTGIYERAVDMNVTGYWRLRWEGQLTTAAGTEKIVVEVTRCVCESAVLVGS